MKLKRLPYLLLLLAPAALAHEFWLAPAAYRVAVGAPVPLRLLVGEDFRGDAWARPTRKTLRLVRFGPAPTDTTDLRPALRLDSVAPAVRCSAPGTHLVLLTSRPSFIELSPDKFTAYLRAEGLDNALRQREQDGETAAKPGREAYQRCAKTLLFASGPAAPAPPAAADTAYRRVLGLPLEIVPEQNPFRLKPGTALTVRVLRRGQPVAGALVQLWNGGAAATAPIKTTPTPGAAEKLAISPPRHFTTHTNRQGRALLRLPDAGPYLLATVRMEPAPAALAARADWLSTWASLTFGGPATPPAR